VRHQSQEIQQNFVSATKIARLTQKCGSQMQTM